MIVGKWIYAHVCVHSNRHVHVNIKFSTTSAFATLVISHQPPAANRQPSADAAAAAAVDINNPHRSKQPTFKCKRLWRMANGVGVPRLCFFVLYLFRCAQQPQQIKSLNLNFKPHPLCQSVSGGSRTIQWV